MSESVNAAHNSAVRRRLVWPRKYFQTICNFFLLLEYSLIGPLMMKQLTSVRLELESDFFVFTENKLCILER